MYGYIRPVEQELKVKELNTYTGYYCGLCKTLGTRYGQAARLLLNYDMTFLAVFLSALDSDRDEMKKEFCVAHHMKKRPVIRSPYIGYAADMTVLLGREKLADDVRDGDRVVTAADLAVRSAYGKAKKRQPDASKKVIAALRDFYRAEDSGEKSCDVMADKFGSVLKHVFLGCRAVSRTLGRDEKRVVTETAMELGRWIYLIDALDDFREDKAKGRYNPLIGMCDGSEVKAARLMKPVLYDHLGRLAEAYELLDIKKNDALLRNMIYLGARAKTEEILKRTAK
jgi:hypothetical protein